MRIIYKKLNSFVVAGDGDEIKYIFDKWLILGSQDYEPYDSFLGISYRTDYEIRTEIVKSIVDCTAQLNLYKMKIMQTWEDDRDRPTYSFGDIINSTLSGVVQGEHNTVMASLNAAGQPELAQALSTLTQAVLASQDLPADQKEEQVKVINQIGKEAAEPKPNKTLLKYLVDGLLATLKAVPDVASAGSAVMPILSQLYL